MLDMSLPISLRDRLSNRGVLYDVANRFVRSPLWTSLRAPLTLLYESTPCHPRPDVAKQVCSAAQYKVSLLARLERSVPVVQIERNEGFWIVKQGFHAIISSLEIPPGMYFRLEKGRILSSRINTREI